MLNAATVKKAIKTAECVEVDYGDKTDDEINALDNALDIVFKAAKAYAEIMEIHKNEAVQ